MKTKNPYRDNEDYMTTTEAINFLGCQPHTFYRYIERLNIQGIVFGKYTYYHRNDIKILDKFLAGIVPTLIVFLERQTGKKVQLIEK